MSGSQQQACCTEGTAAAASVEAGGKSFAAAGEGSNKRSSWNSSRGGGRQGTVTRSRIRLLEKQTSQEEGKGHGGRSSFTRASAGVAAPTPSPRSSRGALQPARTSASHQQQVGSLAAFNRPQMLTAATPAKAESAVAVECPAAAVVDCVAPAAAKSTGAATAESIAAVSSSAASSAAAAPSMAPAHSRGTTAAAAAGRAASSSVSPSAVAAAVLCVAAAAAAAEAGEIPRRDTAEKGRSAGAVATPLLLLPQASGCCCSSNRDDDSEENGRSTGIVPTAAAPSGGCSLSCCSTTCTATPDGSPSAAVAAAGRKQQEGEAAHCSAVSAALASVDVIENNSSRDDASRLLQQEDANEEEQPQQTLKPAAGGTIETAAMEKASAHQQEEGGARTSDASLQEDDRAAGSRRETNKDSPQAVGERPSAEKNAAVASRETVAIAAAALRGGGDAWKDAAAAGQEAQVQQQQEGQSLIDTSPAAAVSLAAAAARKDEAGNARTDDPLCAALYELFITPMKKNLATTAAAAAAGEEPAMEPYSAAVKAAVAALLEKLPVADLSHPAAEEHQERTRQQQQQQQGQWKEQQQAVNGAAGLLGALRSAKAEEKAAAAADDRRKGCAAVAEEAAAEGTQQETRQQFYNFSTPATTGEPTPYSLSAGSPSESVASAAAVHQERDMQQQQQKDGITTTDARRNSSLLIASTAAERGEGTVATACRSTAGGATAAFDCLSQQLLAAEHEHQELFAAAAAAAVPCSHSRSRDATQSKSSCSGMSSSSSSNWGGSRAAAVTAGACPRTVKAAAEGGKVPLQVHRQRLQQQRLSYVGRSSGGPQLPAVAVAFRQAAAAGQAVSIGNNRPSYHAEKQEWRTRYYQDGRRCMRTYSAKYYGFERAKRLAECFNHYVQSRGTLPTQEELLLLAAEEPGAASLGGGSNNSRAATHSGTPGKQKTAGDLFGGPARHRRNASAAAAAHAAADVSLSRSLGLLPAGFPESSAPSSNGDVHEFAAAAERKLLQQQLAAGLCSSSSGVLKAEQLQHAAAADAGCPSSSSSSGSGMGKLNSNRFEEDSSSKSSSGAACVPDEETLAAFFGRFHCQRGNTSSHGCTGADFFSQRFFSAAATPCQHIQDQTHQQQATTTAEAATPAVGTAAVNPEGYWIPMLPQPLAPAALSAQETMPLASPDRRGRVLSANNLLSSQLLLQLHLLQQQQKRPDPLNFSGDVDPLTAPGTGATATAFSHVAAAAGEKRHLSPFNREVPSYLWTPQQQQQQERQQQDVQQHGRSSRGGETEAALVALRMLTDGSRCSGSDSNSLLTRRRVISKAAAAASGMLAPQEQQQGERDSQSVCGKQSNAAVAAAGAFAATAAAAVAAAAAGGEGDSGTSCEQLQQLLPLLQRQLFALRQHYGWTLRDIQESWLRTASLAAAASVLPAGGQQLQEQAAVEKAGAAAGRVDIVAREKARPEELNHQSSKLDSSSDEPDNNAGFTDSSSSGKDLASDQTATAAAAEGSSNMRRRVSTTDDPEQSDRRNHQQQQYGGEDPTEPLQLSRFVASPMQPKTDSISDINNNSSSSNSSNTSSSSCGTLVRQGVRSELVEAEGQQEDITTAETLQRFLDACAVDLLGAPSLMEAFPGGCCPCKQEEKQLKVLVQQGQHQPQKQQEQAHTEQLRGVQFTQASERQAETGETISTSSGSASAAAAAGPAAEVQEEKQDITKAAPAIAAVDEKEEENGAVEGLSRSLRESEQVLAVSRGCVNSASVYIGGLLHALEDLQQLLRCRGRRSKRSERHEKEIETEREVEAMREEKKRKREKEPSQAAAATAEGAQQKSEKKSVAAVEEEEMKEGEESLPAKEKERRHSFEKAEGTAGERGEDCCSFPQNEDVKKQQQQQQQCSSSSSSADSKSRSSSRYGASGDARAAGDKAAEDTSTTAAVNEKRGSAKNRREEAHPYGLLLPPSAVEADKKWMICSSRREIKTKKRQQVQRQQRRRGCRRIYTTDANNSNSSRSISQRSSSSRRSSSNRRSSDWQRSRSISSDVYNSCCSSSDGEENSGSSFKLQENLQAYRCGSKRHVLRSFSPHSSARVYLSRLELHTESLERLAKASSLSLLAAFISLVDKEEVEALPPEADMQQQHGQEASQQQQGRQQRQERQPQQRQQQQQEDQRQHQEEASRGMKRGRTMAAGGAAAGGLLGAEGGLASSCSSCEKKGRKLSRNEDVNDNIIPRKEAEDEEEEWKYLCSSERQVLGRTLRSANEDPEEDEEETIRALLKALELQTAAGAGLSVAVLQQHFSAKSRRDSTRRNSLQQHASFSSKNARPSSLYTFAKEVEGLCDSNAVSVVVEEVRASAAAAETQTTTERLHIGSTTATGEREEANNRCRPASERCSSSPLSSVVCASHCDTIAVSSSKRGIGGEEEATCEAAHVAAKSPRCDEGEVESLSLSVSTQQEQRGSSNSSGQRSLGLLQCVAAVEREEEETEGEKSSRNSPMSLPARRGKQLTVQSETETAGGSSDLVEETQEEEERQQQQKGKEGKQQDERRGGLHLEEIASYSGDPSKEMRRRPQEGETQQQQMLQQQVNGNQFRQQEQSDTAGEFRSRRSIWRQKYQEQEEQSRAAAARLGAISACAAQLFRRNIRLLQEVVLAVKEEVAFEGEHRTRRERLKKKKKNMKSVGATAALQPAAVQRAEKAVTEATNGVASPGRQADREIMSFTEEQQKKETDGRVSGTPGKSATMNGAAGAREAFGCSAVRFRTSKKSRVCNNVEGKSDALRAAKVSESPHDISGAAVFSEETAESVLVSEDGKVAAGAAPSKCRSSSIDASAGRAGADLAALLSPASSAATESTAFSCGGAAASQRSAAALTEESDTTSGEEEEKEDTWSTRRKGERDSTSLHAEKENEIAVDSVASKQREGGVSDFAAEDDLEEGNDFHMLNLQSIIKALKQRNRLVDGFAQQSISCFTDCQRTMFQYLQQLRRLQSRGGGEKPKTAAARSRTAGSMGVLAEVHRNSFQGVESPATMMHKVEKKKAQSSMHSGNHLTQQRGRDDYSSVDTLRECLPPVAALGRQKSRNAATNFEQDKDTCDIYSSIIGLNEERQECSGASGDEGAVSNATRLREVVRKCCEAANTLEISTDEKKCENQDHLAPNQQKNREEQLQAQQVLVKEKNNTPGACSHLHQHGGEDPALCEQNVMPAVFSRAVVTDRSGTLKKDNEKNLSTGLQVMGKCEGLDELSVGGTDGSEDISLVLQRLSQCRCNTTDVAAEGGGEKILVRGRAKGQPEITQLADSATGGKEADKPASVADGYDRLQDLLQSLLEMSGSPSTEKEKKGKECGGAEALPGSEGTAKI